MKRWQIIALLWVGSWLRTLGDSPKATHWAFQPVADPSPPGVTNAAWCRTSLDPFILEPLERHGLSPAPVADRRTLIRRATFDLTGLPPTASETEAFVADTSPQAWERLVDRLLESRHYGEHWGRHWLDVVRYADTAGETADYPVPVAWRYRNYVIDAFNSDKPYDEFLREQLAGDILARQGPRERYAERVTATGYLAISRRFGFDSENYHHLTIQDTIDTVGQSVLGLTLGCARCHAHKYDPVSMQEYYGLYGIFESTRYAFPGSEQKQKSRALVPLMPPEESQPKWQEFERRVATLARRLERQKIGVPGAVLRSLDELDGDFEMQAPAAGGSKGVLVPPWIYEGPIAVTQDAQSPFKNLHPLGKVGASVAAGTNGYRIGQALHPARLRGTAAVIHANLDFRVGTQDAPSGGHHRFWLGDRAGVPAVEVLLSATNVSVRTGGRSDVVRTLPPNQWQNLQLTLNLASGVVSGSVGVPGDVTAFSERPLSETWSGGIQAMGMDSVGGPVSARPAIAFDNLGVQDLPISPVSTSPAEEPSSSEGLDAVALQSQLKTLVGEDGDFEMQTAGTAPVYPWGPGPKSAVTIQAGSQSPFLNVYEAGQLGVRLPNSGAYNGFDRALGRRWDAAATTNLYASFDFRCASVEAGGEGTWRFYLGHGAGASAAVELYLNGREFFRRSGNDRDAVRTLVVGDWYQVQLVMNLKEKRYTGTLRSRTSFSEFGGEFATGWDGVVDFTFIDSHGHLAGVKPALDADNFAVSDRYPQRLTFAGAERPVREASEQSSGASERRRRVLELRQQMAQAAADGEKAKREMEALLIEGPFELGYAVSEGTPRDARIQLRGDPDKPGDVVPRGFLHVLGGRDLGTRVEGSGRLELAEWLTHPSNPLTARVMVNRIWQYHFGQGLVRTPNDFGIRGQRPTSPELLDHLATRFVRSGWSVKAMHRLIMNSAAYRQRSVFSVMSGPSMDGVPPEDCPVIPAGSGRGPGALSGVSVPESFSPFARRRLGAEETRDAILKVSGKLDPTPGRGHDFPAPTAWGYTQHGPFAAVYDHSRRSVYLMTQRIKRHPFLALFDGADPNASTAERRTTIVPTQALYFLNDPFVHDCSEAFADRVMRGAAEESGRVVVAYRLALGRNPSEPERVEAEEFLAAYRAEAAGTDRGDPWRMAHAALARVLFGSNEFLTVD